MKVPKICNRYLFVPENPDDITDEFLQYYYKKLLEVLKRKIKADFSIYAISADIYTRIVMLEKFIHFNKMFDTRYTYKSCMKTWKIKYIKVIKPN
jgi:hypothetical protein